MPDISITQTPSGPVSLETPVTLAVAVSPDPTRYTYSWERADGSQVDGRAILVTASRRTQGRYRVTATPKRAGGELLTAEHTLQVAGPWPPVTPPPNSDVALVFDPWFAAGSAVLILVFVALLLAPLAYRLYDTDAPDAVDRLATLTTLVLLGIGAVVLLLGVYGALLEIRGRLVMRKGHREAGEPGPAIEGANTKNGNTVAGDIGWLRGPVILLLVIGCVPLVAAAW